MTQKVSPSTSKSQDTTFLRSVVELGKRVPVITSRDIHNARGLKLLARGVVIDERLYDHLIEHRLAEPLDESLTSELCVSPSVLHDEAVAAMARLPFFARIGAEPGVGHMVLEAIMAIPIPNPLAFQLTLARETQPQLFQHSVLMALLCAYLVRESSAPRYDMTLAAAAGALHDLGMLHIDPAWLAAGYRMTDDQCRALYAHSLTSSLSVERFREYPPLVSRAILEHHERLDGSGYPQGLSGRALSPLGRVLSLAEVVTAMFDGSRQFAEQRVSMLLRLAPYRFDAIHVASIHRLLQGLPAVSEVPGVSLDQLMEQLRTLSAILVQWRTTMEELPTQVDAALRDVLQSVSDQADTLQRMLYDAGISPDQLDLIAADSASDPARLVELWALGQELQWHLSATAKQVRHRWRQAGGIEPHPSLLAEWLDRVAALDSPG